MRRITHADAPELARLIHAVWSDYNPNPERIARVSLDSSHATFVETDGERLIGFVDGFTTVASDGILRWEVDLLGVDPGYRGRGIARRLIDSNVEAGRKAGAAMTRALVRLDNAPSLGAFARAGFILQPEPCSLFVSADDVAERLSMPPDAYLLSVETLTYSGIWIEGVQSSEALRCARCVRTRFGWDVAGAVMPITSRQVLPEGYESVGDYCWLCLPL